MSVGGGRGGEKEEWGREEGKEKGGGEGGRKEKGGKGGVVGEKGDRTGWSVFLFRLLGM